MTTDPFIVRDSSQLAPEERSRLIVRVKTSAWHDKAGVHFRKDLVYMKRLSYRFNIFEEDCGNIGADQVCERIDNLFEVSDGLYEVVTTNEKRDWETGCIDDYDYMLVPFKPDAL